MKHTKPLTPRHSPLAALLWNLGLLYLCYFLCRGVYVWECWDLYAEGWSRLDLWQLLWGGLRFDTAAIAYTALPWVLMLLLPVSPKLYNRRVWQVTAKSLYVVINTRRTKALSSRIWLPESMVSARPRKEPYSSKAEVTPT